MRKISIILVVILVSMSFVACVKAPPQATTTSISKPFVEIDLDTDNAFINEDLILNDSVIISYN